MESSRKSLIGPWTEHVVENPRGINRPLRRPGTSAVALRPLLEVHAVVRSIDQLAVTKVKDALAPRRPTEISPVMVVPAGIGAADFTSRVSAALVGL